MIREMRKISGAMISMMIDPLMRVVFSGAVSGRKPRRTLRLTNLADLRYMSATILYKRP